MLPIPPPNPTMNTSFIFYRLNIISFHAPLNKEKGTNAMPGRAFFKRDKKK
jgi:hypothetical protein